MARAYKKEDLPTHTIRCCLDPGQVVLVSSAWEGQRDIMTMGWHTVMGFSSSLVGCVIAPNNYSFELMWQSRRCVINPPTTVLLDAVVSIGITSGNEIDMLEIDMAAG